MERQYLLGVDLATYDSLLDGVTFDDLILQVHCNVPKEKINTTTVLRELRDMVAMRLEDMEYLLQQNMDKIIEYSRNYYRDE